jgi:hypothetical protein
VRSWDLSTGKLYWERAIEDAFNLRGFAVTPDGQALVCAHAIHREFPVSKENIERGWVIDSRLTRLPLQPDAVPPSAQLALDTRGAAVGDPAGLAFGPAGKWLAVAGSGTHELLLIDPAAIPWNAGDPGDVIAPQLGKDSARFRRVVLGGRPLGVAFRSERDEVVVANYLLDALQVVDVKSGKLVRSIALGNLRDQPGGSFAFVRRGEALFYDAQRSHNQWFSCSTCHVEGHTCGLTFDTLNDDSYGNPKLTPTLRGVTQTGPWTWHGWQKDLGAGVEKSLTQTMFGPKPSADDVRALVAFLGTLDHPPNPGAVRAARGRLPPAAARRSSRARPTVSAATRASTTPPRATTTSSWSLTAAHTGCGIRRRFSVCGTAARTCTMAGPGHWENCCKRTTARKSSAVRFSPRPNGKT